MNFLKHLYRNYYRMQSGWSGSFEAFLDLLYPPVMWVAAHIYKHIKPKLIFKLFQPRWSSLRWKSTT